MVGEQGEEVGLYKYILNLHAAMSFLMAKYTPPTDSNPAGPGCAALPSVISDPPGSDQKGWCSIDHLLPGQTKIRAP